MEGYVADEGQARHEAAHAVVAYYLGRPVLSINIDPEIGTRVGGVETETAGRTDHGDASSKEVRAQAFFSLCGHIAELIREDLSGFYLGQIGPVIATDVLMEIRKGPSNSKKDLPSLAALLIDRFDPQNQRYRNMLLTKWAMETEQLVATTLWPPILAVAKQLYQQKTMTGAEFNLVIAPFVASGVLPSHAPA